MIPPRHTNIKDSEAHEWTFDAEIGSNDPQAVRKYRGAFAGWIGRCPQMGSAHPDLPGFIVRRIHAEREPGGLVEVTLSYGPANWNVSYPGRPGGNQQIKRYNTEITTSQEPLLSINRYSSLSTTELEALQQIINGNLVSESGVPWESKVTTERGQEALAKIRKGRDSVEIPGLIWVERYMDNSLDSIELDKVGNIDAPPGGAPSGGSRNYLYIGVTAEMSDDGEQYTIERRWRLSGKEGWDPDLYSGGDD